MDMATLKAKYRVRILSIAEKYGIENVRIFGSAARGDNRPDSDLDLLVKPKPDTSLMDIAGMFGELNDLMGHKVDIISESTIPSYAEHIFLEATPL